jgi:predicted PolB exonuclease-like 3'-5' exonuclease
VKWIAFDIETSGRDDVAHLLPEPEADKRLSDPVKVAADLEKKRAVQSSGLSLDANGCSVAAIGWQIESATGPTVLVASPNELEAYMLEAFWLSAKGRTLIGYRSRTFDLPILIQRSRYLGVSVPGSWRDLLAPYGRAKRHIDLFDELTFDNSRQDGVIPRRLGTFCKLFNLDVPHDDTSGADVAALLKAENYEAVRKHCEIDVIKTVALAQRLGVVPNMAAVSVQPMQVESAF